MERDNLSGSEAMIGDRQHGMKLRCGEKGIDQGALLAMYLQ